MAGIDEAVFMADLKSHRVKLTYDHGQVVGVSVEPMFAAHDKNCACSQCKMKAKKIKADSALHSAKHKADCACKACTMGMGGGKARLKADGPSSGGEAPHYNVVQGRKFSTGKRKKLAKSGAAMKDGSYPIENTTDLANAKKDYYRTGKSSAVKSHIRKRAKALGVSDPFENEVHAGGPGSGRRSGFAGNYKRINDKESAYNTYSHKDNQDNQIRISKVGHDSYQQQWNGPATKQRTYSVEHSEDGGNSWQRWDSNSSNPKKDAARVADMYHN